MKSLNLEKINDEVYVANDPIVVVGKREVEFLKGQASANGRRRARICAHKSNGDPLHEMLIVIASDSYIHPHRHAGKTESFHIVEGEVDIVVFDEGGEITKVLELGDAKSGKSFFYRLPPGSFHTLLIKSSFLVVHEITNGPFSRDQTDLAFWAPAEGDSDCIRDFMNDLAILVQQHKRDSAMNRVIPH